MGSIHSIRCCWFVQLTLFVVAMLLSVTAGAFTAIDSIPEEDGFSGYVGVGASYLRVKSNTVAGTKITDFDNDRINSVFSSPGSEELVSPAFSGELRYTFADWRSQLFIGNSLMDYIRFDFSTAAGVRQEIGDAGVVEVSYLFSAIPTKVWKDPYMGGVKRDDTDRESKGGQIAWSRIMGSDAHLQYSYRDIEIDNEQSGTFLNLSASDMSLLDREGTQQEVELMYVFQLAENQWLAPSLTYTNMDLDGEAMKNDRYGVQLTYTYAFNHRFQLVTNLAYAKGDYDKRNPIYGKTQEDNRYGVSVAGFYRRLFDVENLTGVLSAAYWNENSNIDFYDTEIVAVTASTMYKF